MKTIAVVCLLAGSLLAQTTGTKDIPVTGVAGESWLSHLHRALEDTSMGKTGRLGPPTLAAAKESLSEQSIDHENHIIVLHGSDLYRLNCQGCHGESGAGAPPEINSVINPTRATSIALTLERMQKVGMSMSRADAAQLANQSKAAVLLRLHNGGTDMPPFPHLREAEVRSIYAYLKLLSGVPGAEQQQAWVAESPVRVGELVVKSTCHICHSAAGPNPSPEQLMDGIIPPLSSLTTRTSLPEFVRKVGSGAPILMGTPVVAYRGRMPVFYYLNRNEIADAYLYLNQRPPYQFAVLNPAEPVAEANRADMSNLPLVANADQSVSNPRNVAPEGSFWNWPLVAEIFVGLLIIGGLSYTWMEMRRIARSKKLKLISPTGARLGGNQSASQKLPAMPPQFIDELTPIDAVLASRMGPEPAAVYASVRAADHRLFESSWLSRRLDDRDWVA
jgi:mono/diheme cytochrome c family protein